MYGRLSKRRSVSARKRAAACQGIMTQAMARGTPAITEDMRQVHIPHSDVPEHGRARLVARRPAPVIALKADRCSSASASDVLIEDVLNETSSTALRLEVSTLRAKRYHVSDSPCHALDSGDLRSHPKRLCCTRCYGK